MTPFAAAPGSILSGVMADSPTFIVSPSASVRVEAARGWLRQRPPAEEVVILADTAQAGSELVRGLTAELGAVFGWHRMTLGRLASELASVSLGEEGRVPISPLGVEALVARVVHELGGEGGLGSWTEAAATPGFARALARTIGELGMARVSGARLEALAPTLARIFAGYARHLDERQLADRALVFERAIAVAEGRPRSHPLAGRPLIALDLRLSSPAEADLIAAYLGEDTDAFAAVPAGDETTIRRLEEIGFESAAPVAAGSSDAHSALSRLGVHLFGDLTPPPMPSDDSVVVLSAPGESRESVEIARRLLGAAADGIRFDQMAVFLRSVAEYRPHLEEAFARAGIPAHFAQGTVRPDPAGRAFLALVTCRAEGFSARRFAEYLSLGQVPDATPAGAPPGPLPADERWVTPDHEMVPEAIAAGIPGRGLERYPSAVADIADAAPVTSGTLRAPRRWEQLLVDASVIGGRDRWERRLAGLGEELRMALAELEDPQGPDGERIRRQLGDLEALGDFALPLVDDLASLPETADWGEWIDRLSALATRALRDPDRVLAVLGELAPMGGIDGVGLREVLFVLSRRLLETSVPPPRSRYGGVYVGSAESARGLVFEVVAIPGLAEKLFPREIREDPLLLDEVRGRLGPDLETNAERVSHERLALRLGVGAARRRVVLSYPRLDLEKGRGRVPSFYGLEAIRAGEGRLPGFADLASRAESVVEARVGWPAPARASEAIDEAEYDLALLEGILGQDEDTRTGTARYLLGANAFLGRALRFRGRRWLRRWTPADGLVMPSPEAAGALAGHRLDRRSYSPTALEHFSACPYRFYLQAVLRLRPWEIPEPIDTLDPMERGSLIHEVQFEFFRELGADNLLPVTHGNLSEAVRRLDRVLDRVAARFREALAPAIARVWEDGVAAVRTDMHGWLGHLADDDAGFVPSNFELAFGLASGRGRDPASTPDPVPIDCGIQLRGSIDLVERHPSGALRVTDHKTGRVRLPEGGVTAGGSVLQPVLYALVAEKLFPDAEVVEGRLYHCTAAGGYEIRSVPVNAQARAGAEVLAGAVSEALDQGFLPALPKPDACRYCDYRIVCGPYEELRSSRKPPPPTPGAPGESLTRLRQLP